MIYGILYESMLEMYKRQRVRPQYLDFYAITSLVAMEFVNFLTVVVLLAYFNVGSARSFFDWFNGSAGVLVAALLLTANYAYLRFRRRSGEAKLSVGARLHWLASVYMVGSVAVAIYASTLISTFKR